MAFWLEAARTHPAEWSRLMDAVRSLPVANRSILQEHPAERLKGTVTAGGQRRYCTYPFRLFGIASDFLKSCCWLRQVDGLNVLQATEYGSNLQEVWQSRAFDNVRRSIVNGDYLHCNLELCAEYNGDQKYFFTLDRLRSDHPAIADFVSGATSTFAGGPESVSIAYDTSCNLRCPSCNRKRLPMLPRAQVLSFNHSLYQFSDNLQYIYVAGMGDPFASSNYYDWLCNVDLSRFPRLRGLIINTNGLMWTEPTWSAIPTATRAAIKKVIISIDGASRLTYEVNRYPAKWGKFLERLQFIASLRRQGVFEHLRAYFVYQANNYREMPMMVQLCREHAFDEVFFARLTNWGSLQPHDYKLRDVANPHHAAHQDYLRMAKETKAMNSERLQIIVMS